MSGQDSYLADDVENRLRELYAIEQISKDLRSGDSVFEEARDRLEDAQQRFSKALSGAYNRVYYPSIDPINGKDCLLNVTIDNGLRTGEGDHSAENQIEQLLASPRANYKLALDLQNDFEQYWAMAEEYLWLERDRRTPWRDVVMRAKTKPIWSWMPTNSGMDTLKTKAIEQGRWRLGSDGYIEKPPFPKEKTAVNIALQTTDNNTGESVLILTPRNAGASPIIYYSNTANVSINDSKVEDFEHFATKAATLYFLVIDSEGQHETGDPQRWVAELKIRHQINAIADKRLVELRCVPDAQMTYTLDGTNPKNGEPYKQPFEVSNEALRLLVHAQSGDAIKEADFKIPATGAKTIEIIDTKPAKLSEDKRITLDNTETVFAVLNHFKNNPATFKGVTINIGEAENTVTLSFRERDITAAMIENAINGLRQVLNENQALVSVRISNGAKFDSGFDVKEFAQLAKIELKDGDIVQ